MKILLTFATNSGATQQASQIVSDALTAGGHSVDMKSVKETSVEDVASHEVVVLASPSWDYADKEGMPHEDMIALMSKLEANTYENKPFAVLGLGDSSYTVFCGAVNHMEELVKKVKGKLIVPSLRIDGFYYKSENPDHVKTWAESLANKLSK